MHNNNYNSTIMHEEAPLACPSNGPLFRALYHMYNDALDAPTTKFAGHGAMPKQYKARAFMKVLESLQRCPLYIQNRKQAENLNGVGGYMAGCIERILKEEKEISPSSPMQMHTLQNQQEHVTHVNTSTYEMVRRPFIKPVVDAPRKKDSTSSSSIAMKRPRPQTTTSRRQDAKTIRTSSSSSSSSPSSLINTTPLYRPKLGTGAYAVLIAYAKSYHNEGESGLMLGADDIKREAEQYSNTTFQQKADRYYSAWSCMSYLIKKGLIKRHRNPNKYELLSDGLTIALMLWNELHGEEGETPGEDIHYNPNNKKMRTTTTNNNNDNYNYSVNNRLTGTTYAIILLLDVREQAKGENRDYMIKTLISWGIPCELRALPVGDMLFIARCKNTNVEVILNLIIERKIINDLAHSIKDKRFHEQRTRLSKCGIDNVIYLIEGNKQEYFDTLPSGGSNSIRGQNPLKATLSKSFDTALVQCATLFGFAVHTTQNIDDSLQFLSLLTANLVQTVDKSIFRNNLFMTNNNENIIPGQPGLFDELHNTKLVSELICNPVEKTYRPIVYSLFADKNAKSASSNCLGTLFGKQLRMIHGLSADRVLAILLLYPTPYSLFQAYEKCASEEEKQDMFTDLEYGLSGKTLGKAQSLRIYHFFNDIIYSS